MNYRHAWVVLAAATRQIALATTASETLSESESPTPSAQPCPVNYTGTGQSSYCFFAAPDAVTGTYYDGVAFCRANVDPAYQGNLASIRDGTEAGLVLFSSSLSVQIAVCQDFSGGGKSDRWTNLVSLTGGYSSNRSNWGWGSGASSLWLQANWGIIDPNSQLLSPSDGASSNCSRGYYQTWDGLAQPLACTRTLSFCCEALRTPLVPPSSTGSATVVATPTASVSPTGSATVAATPTASVSLTASATVAATLTASVSSAVSISVTATPSVSLTASVSVSATPSSSAAGVASPSASASASLSITASVISSVTASESVSSSYSRTTLPTSSSSATPPSTVSSSARSSTSASSSVSASATASPTASPSASVSPAAFALRFVGTPGVSTELPAPTLAPWLPPVTFSLQARGCPIAGASIGVECGVVGVAGSAPLGVALQWSDAAPPTDLAAAMLTGAALGSPSAATVAPCPSVSSLWADVVPLQALQLLLLPASSAVGRNGVEQTSTGTVRCAATLVGAPLPVPPVTASGLPFSIYSAAWPAVSDVVTLRAGELLQTSVGGGASWNLTGYATTLLAASNTASGAMASECGPDLISDVVSALPLALRSAPCASVAWAILDDAVRHYWTAVLGRPSPASAAASVAAVASGGAFSVVVSDANTVVIVADVQRAGVAAGAPGPFSNATAVSLGGVPLPVLHVSLDGVLLVVVTPQLCNADVSGDSECGGYYTLTLSNAAGEEEGAPPLTLSCPPACGAAAYAGAMPFTSPAVAIAGLAYYPPAASVLNGSVVLAAQPGPVMVVPSALTSAGIYYTSVCAGFTDPTSGVCTNTSSPGFAGCAFGTGAGCMPCPAHSMCPGGPRAWPLPGFYTPYEASGAILPCAPPSSRCLGWDAISGAVICAPAYQAGSIGCAACAARYYASAVGECLPCPVSASPWDAAWPLLAMAAGLAAACACVYLMLVALARCTGGTVEGGAVRLLSLLAWMAAMIQMIGQISSAAVVGSPPSLRVLYTGIAIFQLSGVTIPSACLLDATPFALDVASCLAPLVLVIFVLPAVLIFGLRAEPKRLSASLAVAVAGASGPAGKRAHCAAMRMMYLTAPNALQVLLTALVLLYSRTASIAMGLLQCSAQTLPLAAAVALNGGNSIFGAAAAAAALDGTEATLLVDVHVLVSNPSFICFTGAHLGPAVVAAVTIAIYLAAFPAAVLGVILLRVPRVRRAVPCCCSRAARHHRSHHSDAAPSVGCRFLQRSTDALAAESAVSLGLMAEQRPADALLWAALTHNYRPRAFWVETADLAVLAALAAVNTSWQASSSTDPVAAIARAAVSALLTISLAVVVFLVLPYPAGQRWKTPVRVYSLLLAALCGIINGVATVAALQNGGNNGSSGATSVAVTVLLLAAAGFCAVLVCAFGYGMIRGGRDEGRSLFVAALVSQQRRIQATFMMPLQQRAAVKLPSSPISHGARLVDLDGGTLTSIEPMVGRFAGGTLTSFAAAAAKRGSLANDSKGAALGRLLAPRPASKRAPRVTLQFAQEQLELREKERRSSAIGTASAVHIEVLGTYRSGRRAAFQSAAAAAHDIGVAGIVATEAEDAVHDAPPSQLEGQLEGAPRDARGDENGIGAENLSSSMAAATLVADSMAVVPHQTFREDTWEHDEESVDVEGELW